MNLLTSQSCSAILSNAGRSSTWPEKPGFSKGEKSPQPIAAFLCLPFNAALCRRYSVLAARFGQRSALAGSFTRFFSVPLRAVAQCPEKVLAAVKSTVKE
ncbi:hypothetical protein [Methylomonas koyamae]|uniref:hypothetical protein n=1 Tax=Methylomonas koyamae TaxID=702114 RepID=UPI0012F62B6D|nr:hypothetical protein [Methylomonas koyamae]